MTGYTPPAPDLSPYALTAELAGDVRHRFEVGQYYTTNAPAAPAAASAGNNALRISEFYVGETVRIDRVACEITAAGDAGCTYRLAAFTSLDKGGPGVLLEDFGTAAADTTGMKEIITDLTLPPGLYWFGGLAQGAPVSSPTIRVNDVTMGLGLTSFGSSTPSGGTSSGGYAATTPGAIPEEPEWGIAGHAPRIFVRTVAL